MSDTFDDLEQEPPLSLEDDIGAAFDEVAAGGETEQQAADRAGTERGIPGALGGRQNGARAVAGGGHSR